MKKLFSCLTIIFFVVFSLILFTDVNIEQPELSKVMDNNIVQVDALALVDMNKYEKAGRLDEISRLECVSKDNTIISLTKVNDNYIKLNIVEENGFINHFMNLKFPNKLII